MSYPETKELLLDEQQGVLTITLNRPHKRNAMNYELVQEVIQVFAAISDNQSIRTVVFKGVEGNFCAGGDISSMLNKEHSPEESRAAAIEFNRSFGHMITVVNKAPQVVVCLLEGAVLGGGFGLACVSDVAIADSKAQFAMPETGLGVIPAQIAPFVVSRIGLTQARRLALLGERINGEQAQQLGLCHFVTEDEVEMEELLASVIKKVRRCAPQATAVTKALVLDVGQVELETLLDTAAEQFADSLNSDEGVEGTQAFLQKRQPNWC